MTAAARSQLDADQALKNLFADPDWMFKIGVGGTLNAICLVLGLASPFCLPVVFALMALSNGYVLRVARQISQDRSSKLPDWNNWLELFISGLTWLVVQFGFTVIFLSVITFCLMVGAASGAIKLYSAQFIAWATVSFVLSTFSWCALSFLGRFLMVNFAQKEHLAAGFAFREAFKRATANPGEFFVVWLLAIGIGWAGYILPVISILGIFLIPSTIFIAELLSASLAAQVWQQPDSIS